MYHRETIYAYVLTFVKRKNLKHKIHEFSSGAIMIDIWKGKKFYVIQIERKKVGFSIVDDGSAFSAIHAVRSLRLRTGNE